MLGNGTSTSLMPGLHVLVAAHHGRESGKCASMFDEYGCNPQLVIISDCAKKYQSQETVPYYAKKARGVPNVREVGTVLTRFLELLHTMDCDVCFASCSVD